MASAPGKCNPRKRLEVEADICRYRSRRDVVRSAERGQEIVEDIVVGQVYDGQTRAPFVPVAVEHVVIAQSDIKQIALPDALRIVVIIFGVWRGYLYER